LTVHAPPGSCEKYQHAADDDYHAVGDDVFYLFIHFIT
jgi:hypothetical protein